VSPPLLQRLFEVGLSALPPDRLEELAQECREYGEARLSVRFFVLADAFVCMADAWERPVDRSTSSELNRLASQMRDVVDEPDEEAATRLARTLTDSVWHSVKLMRG
jgi:hypothetical protein